MKLLIVTQAVDLDNPVLGFFHGWIKEFSKRTEHIEVICLAGGRHTLPANVRVHTLGKPDSRVAARNFGKRLRYAFRFLWLIWWLRREYDTVFVHMNQEYVLLGGAFWRVMRKSVLLWRNHKQGTFLTRVAVWLSHRVFCTSADSYTAQFKKTSLMPVGIDTALFRRKAETSKIPGSILFLGRISPVKRVDLFMKALSGLKKRHVPFHAFIVGDPTSSDDAYVREIKREVEDLRMGHEITFAKGMRNEETVGMYNSRELYVNLTPSGSMDKTIFEAMACETLVLTSNQSLRGVIDDRLISEESADTIASRMQAILSLSDEGKRSIASSLRAFVEREHSLERLTRELLRSDRVHKP